MEKIYFDSLPSIIVAYNRTILPNYDAPRACYVDGIWNQEDPEKWLTIIQVPVRK